MVHFLVPCSLMYVNDLNEAIKFGRLHHFADDTNLLPVDNSLKKIHKHINHDLKLLTTWLRANKISLNTSKIENLLFRPKSKRNVKHLNFRISGQYISLTIQVRYLGLTMNEHLNSNRVPWRGVEINSWFSTQFRIGTVRTKRKMSQW